MQVPMLGIKIGKFVKVGKHFKQLFNIFGKLETLLPNPKD